MPEKTLLLPRLGETMTEGTILAWQKQPGETFRRGEPLLELETDKMAVEVPALEDGEMVAHLVAAGDVVAIDAPIATIRGLEVAAPITGPAETAATPVAPAAGEEAASAPAAQPSLPPVAVPATLSPRLRSSPAARRMAQRLGVALTDLRGSGPRGRVTTADVQRGQVTNGGAPAPDRNAAAPATAPASARQPTGKAFLEVRGNGRVHHQRWRGKGSPRGTVLLVHGFAGDLTSWGHTPDFLADGGFDVIAVDLPGHGATEATAATPMACAETLLAALESLDFPSDESGGLHLIGLSLGGAVATYLAGTLPQKVASLTLLAPVGLGTEINQGFLDGVLGAETVPALERELRKTTARPQPYSPAVLARMLATLREEPRSRQLRALAGAFARDGVQQLYLVPELTALTVPVRVIFGRQDRILRWQDALDLPGHVALHLFDTGHMPHWEDPHAVLPLLARFPRLTA